MSGDLGRAPGGSRAVTEAVSGERRPISRRNERARLGFDFGKFDFVVHEGQSVLLDTNRTPSSSPALREFLQAGMLNLAQGMDELIASAAGSAISRWPRR
jgi:hypothetical protein